MGSSVIGQLVEFINSQTEPTITGSIDASFLLDNSRWHQQRLTVSNYAEAAKEYLANRETWLGNAIAKLASEIAPPTTGVSQLDAEQEGISLWSITGVRFQNLGLNMHQRRGMYISNGRKIIR